MKRIPIAGPWITSLEIDYVNDAVANAWYDNANIYHFRFEKAFADYVGVAHAVSLPSCTSGLHLALAALGVGINDEVIVPEITWIATAAPINYVGAIPVFVDVDPTTWCICPDSLEAAITPRTKAVITVDLYGNMADYDRILAIAKKYNIRVIEDAAEAAGARYKGKNAGSFGDVAAFSFHGSKTLTTGEGGMLVTHDRALFDRANFLRDHGRVPGDFSFENSEVAFKYKMSSMQAALGLAQTERLDELIQKKRAAFAWYRERLSGIPGLTMNDPGLDVDATYWMVSIVWNESLRLNKKDVANALAQHGIDTRPFFSPLSSLGAYQHLPGIEACRARNPVSYRLRDCGINLPSSLGLQEVEVDFVCEHLRQIFLKS
ncbi:DegT/DnrJ/EryC1/StrS family aminotransferase [Prosthecobacter sp.]|jgi:perosamine synthetase|uniref:DegT/DnrJ/EryC1/StrS family aminotransferase n=1 Tax=Prosthecobacter sp. TaxID=1965333 RepID=UPI0037CB86F1